ncbi:hypothetical protein IV203_017088 [Nitzschia inconspicua]|uniref:Uncharacterized protein n=1 Tax=Nitzschia inconspicua TaxID=303405 RepID=A0A9K3KR07_9STRA|nr:hypothetical protein IV203_017088 [Nitzschia inconspicua]
MAEEEVVKHEKGIIEDVETQPFSFENNGSPETSPMQKASRRTKKDLHAFLEKSGSNNENSLTDLTDHTTENNMTVEVEI